eukprot:43877-Eustigmatos_ZCMA.PRE.1
MVQEDAATGEADHVLHHLGDSDHLHSLLPDVVVPGSYSHHESRPGERPKTCSHGVGHSISTRLSEARIETLWRPAGLRCMSLDCLC